ncbi:MAG: lipase maturation factor family protein [Deltaproteobacteria bacterium]|nr:lipase maturation factor family protein [Deltaproteobacteria bacterium]
MGHGQFDAPAFDDPPRLVRWLDDRGASFVVVRTLVLRLLGLVHFVAFASAYTQAPALIGEHGLLPAPRYLDAIARFSGSRLLGALKVPSLFWLHFSDAALRGACALGVVLAIAVMLGVTNAGFMLALWALQLSLANVGQVFWGYGWEIQLGETGLLAALLCPMTTWRPFASARPPLVAIWLLRWLIVRIMLGAGLIKLRGDPCWRELTCLVFHYETQPNPSPLSHVLHHMPRGFHVAGVVWNHVVELGAPLLVLGPRTARRIAGALFVTFQAILIASGNLSFLNWLTIVPAIACFDDALLARFRLAPARVLAVARDPSRLHARIARGYALVVALLSVPVIVNLCSSQQAMNQSYEPLGIVNTYGAFGSVTRVRHEVVLQGTSDEAPDAARWLDYELPCKPGDPERRPCLVSPWHYRLDWQMWFAAMSSYEEEPWLAVVAEKLLDGDRSIAPLFARDPFPHAPPRFVRAQLFRYEMTRPGEPGWWRRTLVGEYMRPLSKNDPELDVFLRERGLRGSLPNH